MGRTNPTFRRIIQGTKQDWHDYRRALRREDKAYFDALFEDAEYHADASSYLNPEDPFTAMLFSMLLEQRKQITELKQLIDARTDTDVQG